jgi:hypothetical protein
MNRVTRFARRWQYTLAALALVIVADIACVAIWDDWWVPVFTVLFVSYMTWEFRRGVRR